MGTVKVTAAKTYKRKLSKASLERMAYGGRKGSLEDKRKAGKLGWQALATKLAGQTP